MLHYSMAILEVKTAAGVIAVLWGTATDQSKMRMQTRGKETHGLAFTLHGGKWVHDGTSVRLYEGGYIASIPWVDWTNKEKRGKNKRG